MIDLSVYHDDLVSQEIDGLRYTSSKFPAAKSLEFLGRLGRILGGEGLRLVVMSSGTLGEVFARAGSNPRMFAAVAQILENLLVDPNLPRDLLAQTSCASLRPIGEGPAGGKNFDTHFKGEIPHLLNVLAFVVTHTFAGFTLGSLSTSGSHTSDGTDTAGPSDSSTPSEA